MMEMNWTVVAPILTALASFVGVFLSNRKTAAVMELRLKLLEEKVDKHNQVIERTFRLEQKVEDMAERMNENEH